MNWMQFVASLVGSLAWPTAAVIAIFWFKDPIKKLLSAISKISFAGGTAEFDRAMREIEASAEEESPDRKAGLLRVPTDMVENEDAKALQANPAGVVMEAWKSVELTMRDVIAKLWPDADFKGRHGPLAIIKFLYSREFINSREESMLLKMRILRNIAAHDEEPVTAENAERFQEIAGDFVRDFRKRLSLLSQGRK